MSKVLIYCLPGDFHVVAVQWGLAQLGIECVLWYPGDLPDYQSASFELADGDISVRIKSAGCEDITFDEIGAVWNRRYPKPTAPDWIAKADKVTVEEQCYQHMQGLRHCVSDRIFSVNDPCVEVNASKKLLQLKIAAECGFRIPDTLATNDPEEVARFWARKGGKVVVKPFVGIAWESEQGVHSFFATMMPEPTADLADAIRSAPYIYQEAIADRQFDVRLIFIDGGIYACSIMAASSETIDIRRDIAHKVARHTVIVVPDEIAAQVRAYCARLEMNYGAFDFIVDAGGRWQFLECNSAGQFLWLETTNPEIGLLDAFCKMFARHLGHHVDESVVLDLAAFRESGVWQAEQASWPGPHKPGMIIGGYQSEDREELALLD